MNDQGEPPPLCTRKSVQIRRTSGTGGFCSCHACASVSGVSRPALRKRRWMNANTLRIQTLSAVSCVFYGSLFVPLSDLQSPPDRLSGGKPYTDRPLCPAHTRHFKAFPASQQPGFSGVPYSGRLLKNNKQSEILLPGQYPCPNGFRHSIVSR